MNALDTLRPIDRIDGDHAAASVHQHLRRLILEGAIPPETILPQVSLAARLGISRTPLREAIRMLQEEGLVVAEPQKRARVAPFDASDLEAIYVQRLTLEGLGVIISTPRLTAEERAELEELRDTMSVDRLTDDPEAWQTAHRRFHLLLVDRLGAHLLRAVVLNMDSSERYRLLVARLGGQDRRWQNTVTEHAAIVDAVLAGDADKASELLSAHLARTALTLIAELAPAYDPSILRASLALFDR
jgi:DNA-binding GntR family transcriptional regulator